MLARAAIGAARALIFLAAATSTGAEEAPADRHAPAHPIEPSVSFFFYLFGE